MQWRQRAARNEFGNRSPAVAAKQKGLPEKAPVFIPGPDPFLMQNRTSSGWQLADDAAWADPKGMMTAAAQAKTLLP